MGITSAEYTALVARWGLPNWVRLKSSNFPDRYVRHADPRSGRTTFPDRYLRHFNYLLRIDPLSASSNATDRQDATFRVAP